MHFRFPASASLALLALLLLAGCGHKEISSIDRKTAANQMSEAQFAVTLKDLNRAEGLGLQATKLCPDNADYWFFLGTVQARLAKKSDAKSSYESAYSTYKDAYKATPKNSQIIVQEVYVLICLNRVDDAKSVLQKAIDDNPTDSGLKNFQTSGMIDRMVNDPSVKAISL